MYLIDTNIWLERLLGQEKSEVVGHFLNKYPTNQFIITDFAFHSICVILDRLDKRQVLNQFVDDLFIAGDTNIMGLGPSDIKDVIRAIEQYKLDFDDMRINMLPLKNMILYLSVMISIMTRQHVEEKCRKMLFKVPKV